MRAPVPVYRLEIEARSEQDDSLGHETCHRLETWLELHPQRVRTRRVYHLDLEITAEEAQQVVEALTDPVAEVGVVGMLPDAFEGTPPCFLTVGFKPGVTDSVGASAMRAAADRLGRSLRGGVYTSTIYLVWGIERSRLEQAAPSILYNPLIERLAVDTIPRTLDLSIPRAGVTSQPAVTTVALRGASDEELARISKEGTLALELHEMRAIAAHFREQGRDPTDAELECLAQTWSEHCKHKIFAAPIDFEDAQGRRMAIEEGLFRRYVRGATEAVAARRSLEGLDPEDRPFLVSVFHDNAGVVRFTDADHLVYKVETHNSPSALDPYGGAMTGIVGVNRDSFGTGLGAELLTNVWGYCFADSDTTTDVPPGLMHPRRIRDGVHQGVVDGGNQSGIPYSRGFELFDPRYLGKPLVFCGTVAVMPVKSAGESTHVKRAAVGDKVVMVGGRIGKDGIHGATFSSVELDEDSPVQAVQIGDPITQKMMFDMLTEARERGLYSAITDNGAGGLSSSVGEMAEATGGAHIDLARAPLKYPGLDPWEILISESQERMTLAVPPENLDELLALAAKREVEASVLGEFTRNGRLRVDHGELAVVDLELEFLHEGWPRKRLVARLEPARRPEVSAGRWAELTADAGLGERLLDLLGAPNLACTEALGRRYDHEVKGLSVVKPHVGVRRDVPATATVMRVRHDRGEGVVLAEGVHPYLSDLDARAMAEACVDEAVRRVLCAGARIDRMAALDNFCWPDPILSEKTPDGHHKLAQLVCCCQGLRAACEAYGLPLVSGKDSMKNDAFLGGVKISIPPTLLVSVMGQIEDVRGALTLVPRAVGDVVWLLGETRDELGGSEVLRRAALDTGAVPRTDLDAHSRRYAAFASARDAGLVRSAHVTSRGGLAATLAHLVIASELGLEIDIEAMAGGLSSFCALFSESTGRIVLTSTQDDAAQIQRVLGSYGLVRLGTITTGGRLEIRRGDDRIVSAGVAELRARWSRSGE
jgi:phosphoribosylformylglycinamidine synthase subunit PurSL